jgi:succinoglycan biosynthesis protein ExoA
VSLYANIESAPAGADAVETTIIVPVLNERPTIEAALDAALGQGLEIGSFEVIVVDGGSDDGTRQALDLRAAHDQRLRVLDNPEGGTPQALNIGLAAARGRYWVRLDGHSTFPSDFVGRLLEHLRAGRAEAAGGIVRGVGEGPFGRAAAAVQDSRFGVGNARHHYATAMSYIDHLSHGVYRMDLSRTIGGFDESLVRNQDYDFDYRYGLAGGRILLDASISFERSVRNSPGSLARQFHEYGYWKYVVLRRHPRSFHLRWLAPPVLVTSLSVGVGLSWTTGGRLLLGVVSTAYSATVAAAAVTLSRRGDGRNLPHVAAAMITMHISWGSGFVRSALQPVTGRSATQARLVRIPQPRASVKSRSSSWVVRRRSNSAAMS